MEGSGVFMFRKFVVFLVCTFLFPMTCGMRIPMLDRFASMSQWERNELSGLITKYEKASYDPSLQDSRMFKQVRNVADSGRIARDFVDSCCSTSYALLDPNLHGSLKAMIDNIRSDVS